MNREKVKTLLERISPRPEKTWVWGKRGDDFREKDVAVPLFEIHTLTRIYPIFTVADMPPSPTYVKRGYPPDTYIFALVLDVDAHEYVEQVPDFRVAMFHLLKAYTRLLSQNHLPDLNPDTYGVFTGRGFYLVFPFAAPVPATEEAIRFLGRLNTEVAKTLRIPYPLELDLSAARDPIRPYRATGQTRRMGEYEIPIFPLPAERSYFSLSEFISVFPELFPTPESVVQFRENLLHSTQDPDPQDVRVGDIHAALAGLREEYSRADGERHIFFLQFIGECARAGLDVEEVKNLYETYLLPAERRDNRTNEIPATLRRAKERLERGEPVARLPYEYRFVFTSRSDPMRLETRTYIQNRAGVWLKGLQREDSDVLVLPGFQLQRIYTSERELILKFRYRSQSYEVRTVHPVLGLRDFAEPLTGFGFSANTLKHLRLFVDEVMSDPEIAEKVVIPSGYGKLVYDSGRYHVQFETIQDALKPEPENMFGFLHFQKLAQYSTFRRAIIFAFASVLAPITKVSIKPALWIHGRSGSGKTALLWAASKAFGRELLITADATKSGLESFISSIAPVPAFLDETGLGKGKIAELIFTVASGTSRLRGSPSGMYRLSRFQSYMLTTSETDPQHHITEATLGVFRRIYPLYIRPRKEELRAYIHGRRVGAGWILLYTTALREIDLLWREIDRQRDIPDYDKTIILSALALSRISPYISEQDAQDLISARDTLFTRLNSPPIREFWDWITENAGHFISLDDARSPIPRPLWGVLRTDAFTGAEDVEAYLTRAGYSEFLRSSSLSEAEFHDAVREAGGEIQFGVRKSFRGMRYRYIRVFIPAVDEEKTEDEIPF